MLRVLRAFAWMRWRVLVNSVERTGARDTLERLSIAIEQVAPLVALVLFVPSALATAALGAAAGYAMAGDDPRPLLLEVVRYLLLASIVLAIAGPLAMPSAERTNAVRLLLLPISRTTLYVAQTVGALADPWILLVVPLVLLLPAGLAAGGAFGAAPVAAAAAILLLAVLIGITSLATSLLHMLVRNRRRGEMVALVVILVLPMIGMLPALVLSERGDPGTLRSRDEHAAPAWVLTAGRAAGRAAGYVPTELYVAALRGGARRAAAHPLAALAVAAVALHALGLVVYGRLLDAPGTSAATRRPIRGRRALRLPGVTGGTSAVALAQVRLAVRSPRGRSMLLSPLLLFAMFAAMMYRGGGDMRFAFISLESGLGLATFGAFATLLTILPVAMNQFAIDGAGLTLTLLSPVSDRELLAGKAIGTGLILAGPAFVCIAGAFVVFPGGSAWLWSSLPLALAATYVLITPAAAALSAIFPRAVDMNSIGRGSNAHGAAAFAGFGAYLAAGAPPALIVLLATRVLHQPALTPLLLLVWLAISTAVAAALFVPVRKLFARRRENLAMVV